MSRADSAVDYRPVHLEMTRYGETPHGLLGFHLRFTRSTHDVTCRRCLAHIARERGARTAP